MSVYDPPQYVQRVDESRWVARPSLVPGLRGRAREMIHRPDPMTEHAIGAIRELNNGYQWAYIPHRVRSYVAGTQSVTINRGSGPLPTFRFEAQPIQELGVLSCS